ncbi:MAG: hypothetical protein DHS20C07_04250 [Methyloligella sp.]|nr:MAG: hypothetical protein DHS20C07_04250 [Methyloligella sp.]
MSDNNYRNNQSNDRYDEGPRDNNKRDASNNERQPKSKGPSHIAFQVQEGEEGKSYFNRIGSAFPHKDGEGYNVVLNSTPVDGRVTLRTPKERLDDLKQGKGSNNRGASQQRDNGPQYER